MSNTNNRSNTDNVMLYYAHIVYEHISGYKFIKTFRYIAYRVLKYSKTVLFINHTISLLFYDTY